MSIVGVTRPEHPVVVDVILPLFLFTVVTSGLIGFAELGNRFAFGKLVQDSYGWDIARFKTTFQAVV